MVLENSSRFDFGAHFQPVCDFYSALTHLKNPEVVDQLMRMYELENKIGLHLLRPLTAQSGRVYANYLFLKCLGQSENSELVNKILGKCVEVCVTSTSRQAVASVIALASDLESLTSTGYFPELSQALSGNINMKRLVIKDISTEVLQVLPSCPNLEHLAIGSYLSWSGDTEISCLSDILNQMSLRVLHINGIQEAGLLMLSSSLAINATIKELVIDCSNVSTHGQEVLARALANNTSLLTRGVQKVDFMLKKALKKQICLDFKSDASSANLPDILSSFSTLDISECAIGNAGIVQLSCALQTNTTIKHLTICLKEVSGSGQQALTKALLQNSSLTTLRLKVVHNPFIGDDRRFFNCLRYTKSLTEFHLCPYVGYIIYPCLSGTSVGRALLSGDLVELADILGLNTPPTVDKTLHIYEEARVHIAVDFNNSCFNQLEVTEAWISRMGSRSRAADDSMDPTDENDVILYKDIEELSDLLNKSSLKEINISKCRMGDAGLILLSSALTRNNTIQHLKFNCEEISPHGQTSLAEGLSHNSSLVTLELIVHTHPFLDNDQIFFRSLKQAKSLTEVKITAIYGSANEPSLSDTSVGRALLSGDMVELADILGMNVIPPSVDKTLHLEIYENACIQVNFKKGCFTSVGLENSLNKLYSSYEEKEVIMKYEIGPVEMEKLSATLKEVPVKELNLSTHKIGDKGAIHLGKAISEIGFLEELIMRNCDIREDGIVALALALRANKTLKKLDLYSRNKISQRSEVELTKTLLQNTTLLSLCVNQNLELIPPSLHGSHTIHTFRVTAASMSTLLKDTSTSVFYAGIKNSPIISHIETDNTTSLGQALWAGNMEEAAEILQLHQPPVVDKTLTIHMSGNTWTVIYWTKCVLEDDKEVVRVRSICNNPESWSQLTELKFQFKGSVGACILAKTLNKMQLQTLEINDSGEEEEGTVALCQALSANTTLKSLVLHTSLGYRYPIYISGRSEEALIRALLQNTTLTSLHVNDLNYEMKRIRIKLNGSILKDVCDIEVYSGIKQSPIISHIEIDSTTSLGQALWAGNMEEATEILQLHQPSVVEKTLTLHMSGNTWTVDYRTKCVLEDDKELARVRSICNNPESWSQLKVLTLQFKGSVGACILAKTLNKMQLQELEINVRGEEEEGIVAICQALSGNTTLKSLVLHTSVGPRYYIIGRSEEALIRALLQNTTLTSLHWNYKMKYIRIKLKGSILKDVCEIEIYSGIKQSLIISCIEIDSTTSLGQSLWAGNMEEAAEILQLHQPPVVDKTLTIHMSGNTWTVNYRTKCVLKDKKRYQSHSD